MDISNLFWYQKHRSLHVAAAALCILFSIFALMYWGNLASLLKLLYPAAMTAVGFWLFASRPALFFGFAWWMWMTIPFVRRIVEYQSGFDGANLIMTAPIGVTGLAILTVLRNGALLTRREFAPYGLATVGIFYAYLVGLPKTTPLAATLSLMEWLLPVALAFHLHVHWRLYPSHREALKGVFRWGILIIGIYGVVQYISPMPWDRQWMIASGMNSIGHPEPFRVRVFSMLNAPGPFASVMMAGLVVLLFDSRILARLALGPGFAAFLLSLVRASWGGWLVSVGYMAFRLTGTLRRQLVYVLVGGIVLVTPFLMVGPIADRVSSRAQTVTSIEQDNSFGDRISFFGIAAKWVLQEPIGAGLGSVGRGSKMNDGGGKVTFDSGVLAVPYTLGWLGGLLYFAAVYMTVVPILRLTAERTDVFTVTCAAIVVSLVVQLVFANTFTGLKGILFWTFAGLALASAKYHRQNSPSNDASPPALYDRDSERNAVRLNRVTAENPAGASTL